MYKYFNELENPSDFKTYLVRRNFDFEKKRDRYLRNVCLSNEFFIKYKDLFERIKFIDMLVEGCCEELMFKHQINLTYQEYQDIGDFLDTKENNYYETKYLKEKIDFDSHDLENYFRDYSIYCNFLIDLFPNFKELISSTKTMLNNALIELQKKNTIKVPPLSDGVVYTFPNAWYITPNGYLYNTGTGHQEGDLTYPFYYIISRILRENKNVPNINLYPHILEILDRGYVTSSEFSNYAHLIYSLPTIVTPEVEHDIERYNNIFKLNEEEFEKIVKTKFPHPERSYQKNIITLVIGYLAAKTSLFQSFSRLNDSIHKKEIINELTKMYFDDILVRYVGFHKISSIVDKKITTSSIKDIDNFKEYLEKGWTLDVIPGLIYDKEKDKLIEMDFSGYYIDAYLDKILNKYDKGKILIKK